MNNYRTNSLFHYTSSQDSLIQILESKQMYPNYCKEDLSTKKNPDYVFGIPMICFCDIPISLAGIFVENYGKYAIAFNKQWGLDHKCNPIQYVSDESIIDSVVFYNRIWKEYNAKLIEDNSFGALMYSFFRTLESHEARDHAMGFMKKYKGEWRGNDYCNYEENEWRFVVKNGFHDIWWKESECEYRQWRGDVNTPKPSLSTELKGEGLSFQVKDINHIILYEECEIDDFIKKINMNSGYSDKDKELLLTRITTFERIKNDF